MKEMINLGEVDGKGRIDVLAYRGAEYLTRMIEGSQGLSGLWDGIKPHVNEVIVNNLSRMKIPGEVRTILGILQANAGNSKKVE